MDRHELADPLAGEEPFMFCLLFPLTCQLCTGVHPFVFLTPSLCLLLGLTHFTFLPSPLLSINSEASTSEDHVHACILCASRETRHARPRTLKTFSFTDPLVRVLE